jgi:hypothetical protein
MTWIHTAVRATITIDAELAEVQAFFRDLQAYARLMPDLVALEQVSADVIHFTLREFSNGAVRFRPSYALAFDNRDPRIFRWRPHGEHNFRSRGSYRLTAAGPGVAHIEADVDNESEVDVDPVLLPLIEPFARHSTEQVTERYLAAIKSAIESSRPVDVPEDDR